MSFLRRALLVALIAALAVVPLRAFGVVGGGSSGLSVSASLAGCGVAGESGIVCQIDVSFTGVEDADYYTGTVTRADGSVQDLGTVGSGEGGGSASVSVPYVGSGNYTVTVSAWGNPEDEKGEPELLERDRSDSADEEDKDAGEVSAEPADDTEPADEPALEPTPEPAPAEPAPAEPPPAETLPECRPDTPDATQEAPMDGGESPEAQSVPPPQPPAPIVECTTPSSDSNGPCCPPGA
jgi:hypothetical protein